MSGCDTSPPLADDSDPWSLPDYRSRNALGQSLLAHRTPRTLAEALLLLDNVRLALLGASVDDLRELTS